MREEIFLCFQNARERERKKKKSKVDQVIYELVNDVIAAVFLPLSVYFSFYMVMGGCLEGEFQRKERRRFFFWVEIDEKSKKFFKKIFIMRKQ